MDDRGGHQAAFLDRDGTIIIDRIYLNDPAGVQLLPDAALAIRRLWREGIPSIVVTNQSGIARGKISLAQYGAVHARMTELLAAEGAQLLDTFSCPHAPEVTGPCDCRKPATGLYERAAALYRLDLARCLYVGDKYRDVVGGRDFGGRAVLVVSPQTPAEDLAWADAEGVPHATSLLGAVDRLLAAAP
ncbi:MAG TPA: HAD-IIIA family hydrolase [Gemmatimonadaceae bacterium]|jgi:histidinol-phosphate phosphatase family protein